MTLQGRLRRLAALTIAALAAACALAPSAAGMAGRPADGDLSPRLAELAKPSVRTALPGKQAAILDVARSGPGSLLRDGNRVLVDVRFGSGASAGVDDLRAAGGEIVHVSRRYQTVTVAVPPVALHDVADVARVEGVTENLTPIVSEAGSSSPVTFDVPPPCFGAATSEGDLQLNAMQARQGFGVDGSGVTVGILSDSFDKDATAPTSAADDVASGDLPGPGNPCNRAAPVDQSRDTYSGNDAGDEGRAMAQIVHDLAPGAELAFATAFVSDISFAANIRALADAGAKVIVDDVAYYDEPFFQDGPIAVAVNDVTDNGVAYFSSAGNNNLIDIDGNNIASWEAPSFRDAGCPPSLTASLGATNCMDFDPGIGIDPTFEIMVSNGATLTVDLQWNEPWNGVTADYDAFLLDSNDDPVQVDGFFVGSADDNVGVTQRPVEIFQWENTTGSSQRVRLAIDRCFGVLCNPAADSLAKPRLKFALLQNGGGVTATEYPESSGGDVVGPTIFGHNGAEGAVSTGAIRFNTTSAPETFSSRGPVTHYFGPVNGTTPAAPLGSPKELAKPDLVATDGGANTFFGSLVSDVWRFFGTSASAPHAAAIAALELSARPLASVSDVKNAQLDTAQSLAPFGFGADAAGAGIVDAVGAVGQILSSTPGPTPTPTPTPGPVPSVLTPPDQTAPETSFARRPAKLVFALGDWRRLTFRFKASEADVVFLCKIDQGKSHQCGQKLMRWFKVGKHVLKVKARDAAGNVDPTPAVYRFRVERIG